jgi:hypothetical protein
MLLIARFAAEIDRVVCVNFILLLFFCISLSMLSHAQSMDHAGSSSVQYNVVVILNLLIIWMNVLKSSVQFSYVLMCTILSVMQSLKY